VDEYAVILDQARASIAAGRTPDWSVLEQRLRAVAQRPRAEADPAREERALRQLKLLASVQRARARVAPAERSEPAASPARPAALRERPTITGNMDVRRESGNGGFSLAWDQAAAVASWEVRFSERVSARDDYAVTGTLTLPGDATRVELPLGDATLRVHVLGRARGGRLVRRAIVSGLTRESWPERWQRRASAS
jgi:hypothetical protein